MHVSMHIFQFTIIISQGKYFCSSCRLLLNKIHKMGCFKCYLSVVNYWFKMSNLPQSLGNTGVHCNQQCNSQCVVPLQVLSCRFQPRQVKALSTLIRIYYLNWCCPERQGYGKHSKYKENPSFKFLNILQSSDQYSLSANVLLTALLHLKISGIYDFLVPST